MGRRTNLWVRNSVAAPAVASKTKRGHDEEIRLLSQLKLPPKWGGHGVPPLQPCYQENFLTPDKGHDPRLQQRGCRGRLDPHRD